MLPGEVAVTSLTSPTLLLLFILDKCEPMVKKGPTWAICCISHEQEMKGPVHENALL